MTRFPLQRHWFVPEVVQTSAMDCGPATLAAVLHGFAIPASYGRLREACQTDLDGTSIDTLEEVAMQLGLVAEQIMLPLDHVLLDEAQTFPAIVVVTLPGGVTHFVVAWRRHGPFVQVMDPATGRRLVRTDQFLNELFIHTHAVPTADWRVWAGSDAFLIPLRCRMEQLGLERPTILNLITTANADEAWYALAALDAATRMVASLVRANGVSRGQEATQLLTTLYEQACIPSDEHPPIPSTYWSVQPAPPDEDGNAQLFLQGALMLCVRGHATEAEPGAPDAEWENNVTAQTSDVTATLTETAPQPARELVRLLGRGGLLTPMMLLIAALFAAGSVVVEELLFRGLIDLGQNLALTEQRMGGVLIILVFAAILLLLDFTIAAGTLRLGRHSEVRLRMAFLRKIPLLGDRYFQSRPISDMAERGHNIYHLRQLTDLVRQLALFIFELILTTVALALLYPPGAPVVVTVAILLLGMTLLSQPLLGELDLRVKTHIGALGRFHLDSLLGMMAIRTHRAERSVRRAHERLLVEWAHASFARLRMQVVIEAILPVIGYGAAIWLLFDYMARGGEVAGALLLIYWALKLPLLSEFISQLARLYPTYRNTLLRLLEPLGAPEEQPMPEHNHAHQALENNAGMAIALKHVTIRAAGHTILDDISLAIEPGEHVAIVGPSGAGKSSLVGILLGWFRPALGEVFVDEQPLDVAKLDQVRAATAWVDPSVHLWNQSFLHNLRYGTADDEALPIGQVIERADLHKLLERLPAGLQTPLGEGGALVSGGEGQRVRLGRALLRPNVRLVILDEPFRGLDRRQRNTLLTRTRQLWAHTTLLCITHDVSETMNFERVIVVQDGRIIEDGQPHELAATPTSRYRKLLDAETSVRQQLWSSAIWRRLRMEDGQLIEESVERDQHTMVQGEKSKALGGVGETNTHSVE